MLFYPVRTSSGLFESRLIEWYLVPPLPPPREFFATPLKRIASVKSIGSFTVMSYNILSEIYATRQMYPYCPMWALAWTYRKQRIAQELLSYRADIICLQVGLNRFFGFLSPFLKMAPFSPRNRRKPRRIIFKIFSSHSWKLKDMRVCINKRHESRWVLREKSTDVLAFINACVLI